MMGKGKAEKEKLEWQLALVLSEKRMIDGMQEICDTMKESEKIGALGTGRV